MSTFEEMKRTFVRVYLLPAKLTGGYCFGAGVPITFLNVDWFEAPLSFTQIDLVKWIETKSYYRADHRYLVLADDPQFTFTIDPSPKGEERIVQHGHG